LVFTGTYQHAIDAKNRVAIPSEVRSLLARSGEVPPETPVCWYVTLGEEGSLSLYTESGFEKRAAELDQSELDAEELLDYERFFFSLAQRVEQDKSGRVRLPEQLVEMTDLQSEVVLIGVKDHLEIRDRQRWREQVEAMLKQRAGAVMNPRRAMRKSKETPDESE